MIKYKLSSELGSLFAVVTYIIGIGMFLFLIYCAVIQDIVGVAFLAILLIYIYFKFCRVLFRSKKVSFDSERIFTDERSINLKDITNIQKGKITYMCDGEQTNIYYNYFYSENYDLLKKYWLQ